MVCERGVASSITGVPFPALRDQERDRRFERERESELDGVLESLWEARREVGGEREGVRVTWEPIQPTPISDTESLSGRKESSIVATELDR